MVSTIQILAALFTTKKDTSTCAYASITTSTLPWGQSKTSYTTTSTTKTAFVVNKATRGITYTEEVDYITEIKYTPVPAVVSTANSYISGSSSTTLNTVVTALSSGGTLTKMSTLYVIGIPSKFSTLYTTTDWTGTVTLTYSTDFTTTTGMDGVPEQIETIYVETPVSQVTVP